MAKVYTAPAFAKASSESQCILMKARRTIVESAPIMTSGVAARIYESGFKLKAMRLALGAERTRICDRPPESIYRGREHRRRPSDSIYTVHQRAALATGVKNRDFVSLSRLSFTLLAAMFTQSAGDLACAQTSVASDQEAWQVAEVMANKFQTAYNVGDVAAIANLFVDNAYYFTPGGTVLYGWDRQAIQRAIAARIRAGWTKEVVKITEAHSAGEAVWVTGEYVISGMGQNQGKQIDGYFAQVITRIGGEWRFRLVIANLKPSQDVTGMSDVKGIVKPP